MPLSSRCRAHRLRIRSPTPDRRSRLSPIARPGTESRPRARNAAGSLPTDPSRRAAAGARARAADPSRRSEPQAGPHHERRRRSPDDRSHPRALADAAKLGALGRSLRGARPSRHRAGLARDGGRGRGPERGPDADRRPRHRDDRRPLRRADRGPRRGADHHRPLLRRRLHAAARRPRPRQRRRRCGVGHGQGRSRPAAIDDQGDGTGPPQPAQPRPSRSARRAGSSTTPSRTPCPRPTRMRSTSATRFPAAATVLFEGAFANLHRIRRPRCGFENDERAPLLFIAFENDHIIPPKATRHNAEKYAGSRLSTASPSSRAAPTSLPRPTGRRSPTSPSTGRSTRGRSIDPTRIPGDDGRDRRPAAIVIGQ